MHAWKPVHASCIARPCIAPLEPPRLCSASAWSEVLFNSRGSLKFPPGDPRNARRLVPETTGIGYGSPSDPHIVNIYMHASLECASSNAASRRLLRRRLVSVLSHRRRPTKALNKALTEPLILRRHGPNCAGTTDQSAPATVPCACVSHQCHASNLGIPACCFS